MNFLLSLRRSAVVAVSVLLGAVMGLGILRVAGQAIARHLPAMAKPTGADADGFGAAFAMLMNIGYNIGLVTGVLMTLAILGGLVLGFWLSRRLGSPAVTSAG